MTSIDYKTKLRLLDMSKAFDTIRRYLLIEDVKEVLKNDEIHSVALLLKTFNVVLNSKIY